MKIKITLLFAAAIFFAAGCALQNKGGKTGLIGFNSVKADTLATYYNIADQNGAVYYTKQKHIYDVDGMKMKVNAVEPKGAYEMTYSGSSISLSDSNAAKFWNAQMAQLLAYAFSVSSKYTTPESLSFEKSDSVVRIQGILYNVYTKNVDSCDMTLFARTSDGAIDRLQATSGNGILSAFCYNGFYESSLDKTVVHNIDIYTGAATGIDTKLIYSAKFTGF